MFEVRKLCSECGDAEVSVIWSRKGDLMVSLTYKDIFYDNSVWLSETLIPALYSYFVKGDTSSLIKDVWDDPDFPTNRDEMFSIYELLLGTEALGWL